ncbi:MAG: glycyl-radical enzyme activating protein [Desulfobacterales bacterium]|nr:glycyl-radical enzyme activating protein [Desulfobacterales bacterium]
MSSLLDRKETGMVFSIQKFSVHDGPGIRTIAFLKGCPLRCQWCSNPESQSLKPQIGYNRNKCIGFEKCTCCIERSVTGAITRGEDGKIDINHDLVKDSFFLADECPSKAIIVYGEKQSVDDVLKRVEEDDLFYARSGGGMTLSGGEPFAQPEFALALLREARHRRIDTAVESCGACKWEILEKCLPFVNTLMFDIKSINTEKHIEYTTQSNERILGNLKKLKEKFPNLAVRVRTPVIPGFNDTQEDIAAIIDFISALSGKKCEYEILGYHRMGQPKYTNLGRDYLLKDAVLDDARLNELQALVDAYNYQGTPAIEPE